MTSIAEAALNGLQVSVDFQDKKLTLNNKNLEKEWKDICVEIKITQSKMEENESVSTI